MFLLFLNCTEMFPGMECQQAVAVAGTEKIRNFANWFMQKHLATATFKKQNDGTYPPTHLVLLDATWTIKWFVYLHFHKILKSPKNNTHSSIFLWKMISGAYHLKT